MKKEDPIGIFDSGLGGLTVANAVYRQLRNEQLIYFGDSAHLPYGDKSAATIQAYSVKICDVLLQKNAKLILIACNSASAAAYELVKAYVGSKAKVLNVIDPVVNYVAEKYAGKHVGLIGTKQTVGSGVYEYQLRLKEPSIKFSALAAPLLVPMIEEGFHNNNISEAIIEQYLNDPVLEGINTLILGCTHYPLIKEQINNYYGGKIEVIDSSVIVAKALEQYLGQEELSSEKLSNDHEFLVSDITPSFEVAAELFFGRKVPLQKHILWE